VPRKTEDLPLFVLSGIGQLGRVSKAFSHPAAQGVVRASGGMGYGLLGVLCFSLTLPATRLAVSSFDPLIVGLGRAALAAVLAMLVLWRTRQRFPSGSQWKRLAVVAFGVIIGFPVLSSWAMQRVEASHGAVVLGLLPMATALVGCLRSGERPGPLFWCASAAGSAAAVAFPIASGCGGFQVADLALFGAVILCAFGYAEGACLAREMGGWQVISWALTLSLPVIALPLFFVLRTRGWDASPGSWLGLGYLGGFSSFLGFFAWYRGLAEGGIARVSQCQLLQPFFTLSFAALFLGERIPVAAAVSASVVCGSVWIARRGAPW